MKKKICFGLLIILIIIQISTIVFADQITDTMSSLNPGENPQIIQGGGKIYAIVLTIGMGVALVMLIVIAIRFMLASASGKAQLKEQLIPYVIGAVLLMGVPAFLGIAYVLGSAINKL